MLDSGGHIVSWNAGAQRVKGYNEDEIVGKHCSRFYTPEDRKADLPSTALQIATETGRFESEGWRLRKSGERFWAHVVIDAIRDGDGKLIGYVEITRDLTERKRAAEELRQSEKQFRMLVQGVTDYAIYMLDPDGCVSSWNVGAHRIKGYSAEEILGEHFSRFYTHEDREAGVPDRALETAAKEGRYEKEGWRVRKDGSRFWASVIIDAIHDDAGSLLGFAKITRDITEKMEAQRALERAREELFQAQKMEAIGQLTGGVAHDFNNLLMAILGSLDLLKSRLPESPDISPLIENAIKGAERGTSLTQRLLAFSRRQQLTLQAVDVVDLVRRMKDLLQTSLGPAVQIETRFPLKLPNVSSDQNQLENALLNLAVNARDAMPNGGELVISAKTQQLACGEITELEAGSYVCLSVKDNGEGMDEQTLVNATTPFFTTKGIGKGTGLGLSMVQGLMGQCGGKLVLRSEEGEGTTAELWLRAVDAVEHSTSKQEITTSYSEVAMRQSLRVLAVDDDSLVLMNTVLMLEDLGHCVVEAQSGEDALRKLHEGDAVDLIITDEGMPRMKGSELVHEVRKTWPGMPIILATGYGDLSFSPEENLKVLNKPFMQRQLANVIKETMGEPRL